MTTPEQLRERLDTACDAFEDAHYCWEDIAYDARVDEASKDKAWKSFKETWAAYVKVVMEYRKVVEAKIKRGGQSNGNN